VWFLANEKKSFFNILYTIYLRHPQYSRTVLFLLKICSACECSIFSLFFGKRFENHGFLSDDIVKMVIFNIRKCYCKKLIEENISFIEHKHYSTIFFFIFDCNVQFYCMLNYLFLTNCLGARLCIMCAQFQHAPTIFLKFIGT
jgi:hypothetical protein